MSRFLHLALCMAAALALASCGSGKADDEVDVAFIGSSTELFEPGLRLAPAGQHIRSATAEGLVSLNQSGEVVPALAERWIVTEDGLSYIFRLRNTDWADGIPLTSNSVRDALRRNIQELRGTSLGLDLAKVEEIRAMTGRVVEIRLDGPMPEFLQLLAQPELGLRRNRQGTGPMTLSRERDTALLAPLPPETRGLPVDEDWESRVRTVRVQALPAEQAVAAFDNRAVDAVFGGTLTSLPLADTGALSRGTVRLDAALGLLGLQVVGERGLLATESGREALAMAIDRQSLLQPFNIGGWIPTTRVVAPDLPGDPKIIGERWNGLSLELRQAEAARRVAAVAGTDRAARTLSIAMPPGPGSDLLFRELSEDLAAVGVVLERASESAPADLVLVDRLARYADARWFLNQFHCSLKRGLCSPEADEAVRRAMQASDPAATAAMLAEAEARLTAANVYIPIGAPIRWSLVRGGVDGFSENNWGLHPLFPLALRPI
ncbi:ABC transporter substrate-binding protein [Allopontixanthobacter sp.]|uniref:ABC transporter substrate-binding protein n=1 Tax=Allopontixanthobacter sp. TaxID=2906452 RepID=UPI002ABC788E|nr:ABC transporter substrate-binding protein [Allopontixanthobacter sp.]MDZ4308822.1 ABC transporter substrate-binding protein [Allopontixanthobacter sp.]